MRSLYALIDCKKIYSKELGIEWVTGMSEQKMLSFETMWVDFDGKFFGSVPGT